MSVITKEGRKLANDLEAKVGATFGLVSPVYASRLNRAAIEYQKVQTEFCNGDDPISRTNWEAWDRKWNHKAERIESNIRMIVADMFKPEHGVRVKFEGDPRGFCVYLMHPEIGGNTMGGDEHGYGVGVRS